MRINLSGWYYGKISVGDIVLDITTFPILRPKVTQDQIIDNYNQTLEKVIDLQELFEDKEAFLDSVKELNLKDGLNKTRLLVKEPSYPPLFWDKQDSLEEQVLDPKKALKKHRYFSRSRLLLKEYDIEGTNAKIEIPSNRTKNQVKIDITHLTLSYLIEVYQNKTNRHLDQGDSIYYDSVTDRIIADKIVDGLTDIILEDDKKTQIESRYLNQETKGGFTPLKGVLNVISLASIAYVGYKSLNNPSFLFLMPAIYIARNTIYSSIKKTKGQEYKPEFDLRNMDLKI